MLSSVSVVLSFDRARTLLVNGLALMLSRAYELGQKCFVRVTMPAVYCGVSQTNKSKLCGDFYREHNKCSVKLV